MLLTAAILGWLAALVLAVLRWRHVCRQDAPRVYQHTTATHTLPLSVRERYTAELYAADGTLESVRQLTSAPVTIHRPHGRGSATVYRRRDLHGRRAIYHAES